MPIQVPGRALSPHDHPAGRLMLTVIGGLAELERELVKIRTSEGCATVEPIFFDFETDLDNGVYLLGTRLDHRTTQYLCVTGIVGMSIPYSPKIAHPYTACRELLSLREKTGRLLACYSSHDGDVLCGVIPNLCLRYLDIHKLAKSWIKRHHYDEFKKSDAYNRGIRTKGKERWAFAGTAAFVGIDPPHMYARGRRLRRRLLERRHLLL
jgi:hypothetical protein